jgi:hypothetical protein
VRANRCISHGQEKEAKDLKKGQSSFLSKGDIMVQAWKDVDRADQYLSYYSILRKTVTWSRKMELYLINWTLLNTFFMYKTLNRNRKTKYKKFLHELVTLWILETNNPTVCGSDKLQQAEKESTPKGPKQDPPRTLANINWRTLWLLDKGRSVLQDCKVCATHKKHSETRYILCCSTAQGSCFERFHTVKHY